MSAVEINDLETLFTTRAAVSQQLSALYLRRDECWLTGEDKTEPQQQIAVIEREHIQLLSPCHLCDAATIFRDDAYELPFCWRCLQERYDLWYRHLCYRRSGQSK
jgi:hypothetical protein